jgi:integrase
VRGISHRFFRFSIAGPVAGRRRLLRACRILTSLSDKVGGLRQLARCRCRLGWGECLGLRWADVDLGDQLLTVERVVVEVRGQVAVKPYPKSMVGRRTVPLAPFLLDALTEHRELTEATARDPVFTGPDGGHLLRGKLPPPDLATRTRPRRTMAFGYVRCALMSSGNDGSSGK